MEELTEGILERLDALALSLGTTVEHLWEVLVVQARVAILEESILACILGILGFLAWKVRGKLARKIQSDDFDTYWETEVKTLMWITGILSFLFILIIGLTVSSFPTKLLNPEYYALQQVLALLQ